MNVSRIFQDMACNIIKGSIMLNWASSSTHVSVFTCSPTNVIGGESMNSPV
jgi:hypothetical protein